MSENDAHAADPNRFLDAEACKRFEELLSGAAVDDREEAKALLANIKTALPQLQKLFDELSSHWGYENLIYRFYHQSWKVYDLQVLTAQVVDALRALAPEANRKRFEHCKSAEGEAAKIECPELHPWFIKIIEEGMGKEFQREHNRNWLSVTRPILEAFFHARYFLEMTIRYGLKFKDLAAPPAIMPSGWAAVLYLYSLR